METVQKLVCNQWFGSRSLYDFKKTFRYERQSVACKRIWKSCRVYCVKSFIFTKKFFPPAIGKQFPICYFLLLFFVCFKYFRINVFTISSSGFGYCRESWAYKSSLPFPAIELPVLRRKEHINQFEVSGIWGLSSLSMYRIYWCFMKGWNPSGEQELYPMSLSLFGIFPPSWLIFKDNCK